MNFTIPINNNSKKDISIETIRGVALILMVAAHVIGSTSMAGMRVDDDSFWRYLYMTLVPIRMPLFTVISGYVYALRPLSPSGNVFNFIKGKIRRLMLPLITIATLQYFFQAISPGVNKVVELKDIWKIYIFPYNQFWFIQAIFIIFIIVAILDYYDLLSNPLTWFISLVIACFSLLYLHITNIFSANNVTYLLPFFILGLGICRFEDSLFKKNFFLVLSVTLLFITVTLQQLKLLTNIDLSIDRNSIIALIIGISATFLIVRLRFRNKFLAFIGFYSYGIFLLHIFGTASSRILMESLNLNANKTILFFVSLTSGIIVPLIIQFFIYKFNILKTILLGLKYPKKVDVTESSKITQAA